MRAWIKWLIEKMVPTVDLTPTTVIIADTTHCMVSRIGDDIELVLVINGHVEHSAERAEVRITLSDPASLHELCIMTAALCPIVED